MAFSCPLAPVAACVLFSCSVASASKPARPVTASSCAVAADKTSRSHVYDPPVSLGGVDSDAEREAFEALLSDAWRVLASDRFHSNLRSLGSMFPQVYVHFLGEQGSGKMRTAHNVTVNVLSDIVAAKANWHYVRSPAFLTGDQKFGEALTGWTGTSAQVGSMSIGRLHLARWRSTDKVEQSCAVNTIAHEMSHLVSNSPKLFMAEITDDYAATLTSKASDGSDISPPNAVASYLIGSVAQCTWLQERGYTPEVDLEACLRVFGHRGHNGFRCREFSGNREVRPRDDLSKPYELIDRQ